MAMLRIGGFVRVVDKHELLDAVEEQKADVQRHHRAGGIDGAFVRQFEDLRQDLEADHAEQNAGCEAEQIVQPIAKPEREQAAPNVETSVAKESKTAVKKSPNSVSGGPRAS
jgi:hypothetical protein